MTYANYLQQCQERIKQRPDYLLADENLRQNILQTNSPFEWAPAEPARKAVILIHGLYDSPCVMQSLAQFFHAEHYWVRSLLLPGHGTRPEDLLDIDFEQWLTTCRLSLDQLPSTIDHIVLCGFSAGGLLSHYLALAQEIPRLSAIIAFAPALALRAPAWFLRQHWLCKPLAKLIPWYRQGTRYDYAHYNKHALNAACQIQRLIDQCSKFSSEVYAQLPVFYVLSTDDEVIHTSKTWQFFQDNCTHPQSRCLLYGDNNELTDPRLIKRSNHWPKQNINSFSHIAMPVAPDHLRYGRDGDYTRESLQKLKPGQPLIMGRIGGNTTVRLSYNPDFAYLTACLQQFLDNTLEE